jgi:hypothetical protein
VQQNTPPRRDGKVIAPLKSKRKTRALHVTTKFEQAQYRSRRLHQMKFTLFAALAFASTLCFADNFTGKLVDVACADHTRTPAATPSPEKSKADSLKVMACTPTATTKMFGVETAEGKILKLDAEGNTKAMSIFKDAKKPEVDVMIDGAATGDSLKVESISAK